MATAQDIKNRISKYMNMLGQTTLLENDFFETAHREIQRRHNFKCMEVNAYATLATGANAYTLILDTSGNTITFKEPRGDAVVYDQTLGVTVGDLYHMTGALDNHKRLNNDSAFEDDITTTTRYFSFWGDYLQLWPIPTVAINGFRFIVYGWKWLAAPVGVSTDWFTIHAADYLFYRSIYEAIPYLPPNPDRDGKWLEMAERAFDMIRNADVQTNWAGPPIRARG